MYIQQQEPNAQVAYVCSWLSKHDMPHEGWKKWLKLKLESGTVLIVDEAQSSYWDKQFYINPDTPCRVMTLASYGSTGYNIYDLVTPFYISQQQNIGLIPVDHGGQTAVGLLMKAEFDEVMPMFVQKHQSNISFLDSVFDITHGHVGACEDFLCVVLAHPVRQSSPMT